MDCARVSLPPSPSKLVAVARLELIHWPGAEACNQLTWANDCGGNLAAAIDGTSVTLTPAVAPAFKALCPASAGVAIGQGSKAQAAVAFPQHPVGVVSAKPDGTVTFDFTRAASDDADWSKCMLTYRVAEGSFLQAGTSSQSSSLQAASQSFQGFQSSLGAKQVSAQKTTTPNNRGLIVSTSVLGGVAAALALGNLFDLK
ncbi:hypothetical protein MNEG_1695 [Monoraphidium neglectum]|uniref:Uncharacterized protein n=1 Tax=Monoraphidium neglectum TaxID=145388 RepID=A0A0D2LIK0_9CHLO|nr:hypothetical protein MNEG_1695 [Monoraphidium neglectum]KIZ06269.1 hypothetical protein MNEG_1695 [Monoraphidium neglectum]|eukprot:XP_013905288.1 hypothetical protein MNEG_1695 [Monoraphidium neglectum]